MEWEKGKRILRLASLVEHRSWSGRGNALRGRISGVGQSHDCSALLVRTRHLNLGGEKFKVGDDMVKLVSGEDNFSSWTGC